MANTGIVRSLVVRKLYFHFRRTFRRRICSGSTTSQNSFDEAEVRKTFKLLGKGDVTLTKLTGNQEGIGLISLSNPERKNALTGHMMVRLAEIVDEVEQWQSGKALVLHGIKGSFCSGADLSIIKAINTPEQGNLMCAFMQRTLTRLGRLPLVSVAAIDGRALGGGAELATACDFRLMSRDAEMRFVQVKMGLTPGWGGGARLVRLVGQQKAMQLLGRGEKVDLSYGCQLGLVDDELPNGKTRFEEEADMNSEMAYCVPVVFQNLKISNPRVSMETPSGKDVVISSCEWLSEFLHADHSVLKGIKGVVNAGHVERLENELDIERSIFTSLFGAEANKQALEKAKKHR